MHLFMYVYVLVWSCFTPIQLTAIATSHGIPFSYSQFQTTLGQTIGVIDFKHGVIKRFQVDSKTWQDTPSTVPKDLLWPYLGWPYRVCAKGGGRIYVLNTRSMVLHCLDMASGQWVEKRQVDTSYRAQFAAMTYSNGRLYVSGGESLHRQEQNTMVSLSVGGAGNSRVTVQKQPDMLYRRSRHRMAGVGRRILVCCGMGDTSLLANSEVFNLGIGTWSLLTGMPVAKDFGLIPIASAVFMLGGVTGYELTDMSPILLDTVSVFDWKAQQCTPLPTLPMPLSSIQGVYMGESLWVLAAVTGLSNNPGKVVYDILKYVLQYDVKQQRWVTHHNTPSVGTQGIYAYTFPM